MEEIKSELNPEEYLTWTSNYDKDMNLLEVPITRLVKDLDSDHINAIYDYVFKRNQLLSPRYRQAFKNILTSREESINHINAIEMLWAIEEQLKEIE
jgi:hypothetical protein